MPALPLWPAPEGCLTTLTLLRIAVTEASLPDEDPRPGVPAHGWWVHGGCAASPAESDAVLPGRER